MFRRTLLLAALLIALPLIVGATDDTPTTALAETIAVEVAKTEVTEAQEANLPGLYVAEFLKADFRSPNTRWGCSQPSCDHDFQCGWMKQQCVLHEYPACVGGTGSGCQGQCECTCG